MNYIQISAFSVFYALQIAKSLPRICFLSGLSGEEMMMFIDSFPETGNKNMITSWIMPLESVEDDEIFLSWSFWVLADFTCSLQFGVYVMQN